MAECLCCSSKTITALLIGYTPIQNKKYQRKKNLKRKFINHLNKEARQVWVIFQKLSFNSNLLQSSPVAQWLGFQAFTAMACIQSLVGKLRSCKSMWYHQKEKQTNKKSNKAVTHSTRVGLPDQSVLYTNIFSINWSFYFPFVFIGTYHHR